MAKEKDNFLEALKKIDRLTPEIEKHKEVTRQLKELVKYLEESQQKRER